MCAVRVVCHQLRRHQPHDYLWPGDCRAPHLLCARCGPHANGPTDAHLVKSTKVCVCVCFLTVMTLQPPQRAALVPQQVACNCILWEQAHLGCWWWCSRSRLDCGFSGRVFSSRSHHAGQAIFQARGVWVYHPVLCTPSTCMVVVV